MFGWADALPFGNGVLIYDRPIALREITDGSAQTIVVAEDTGRGTTMNGDLERPSGGRASAGGRRLGAVSVGRHGQGSAGRFVHAGRGRAARIAALTAVDCAA
jgi:hypothetical protein